MKIAVITRHAVSNYGSLLQAFATQQVLESMGYTCEIIDYIRDDETYTKHEITLLKGKAKWNNNLIKKMLYLLLRQPEAIIAGKKFAKERKIYLKTGRRYSNINELVNNKPEANVYITGSDQVWGPVENGTYDPAYCLSFTYDEDKRIAYAASFGRTEMDNALCNFFSKNLSRYNHIAVREDSAVLSLNKIGIEAKQVLDPTLLLDKDTWMKYTVPVNYGEYILVYQLHHNDKLDIYAKAVSKKMNIKLIRVSATLHQITRSGKFVWLPNVKNFLSLISNAKYMITDSFHGTAFAINFNIPFVEILPNNKTGSRNISILKMTQLTERILVDEGDYDLVSKSIDFNYANSILNTKREESIQILKSMIEE